MNRTRQNRFPDLILCSDMHFREDTPTCWTGNFQLEQWTALQFIKDLQMKFNCPVVHAGDLLHHWKASPWVLSMIMQHIPDRFFTIAGQHDLPQHSLELIEKSGLNTLVHANKITLLPRVHFGLKPEDFHYEQHTGIEDWLGLSYRKILIWHHMTYITPPYPGATEGQATGILKKYPQFDLILTGDNHQSFSTEYEGRLLVNPGSMTRQTADQMNFQPRVALWYAESNDIEWINLPTQENAISREHIEVREERNKRLEAFISTLNGEWQSDLSFENNLERFFEVNNIRDSIKGIIYKAIG